MSSRFYFLIKSNICIYVFCIQRQQLKIKDQPDPTFCLSVLGFITWQRKSHFTTSYLLIFNFSLAFVHCCFCVFVFYVCSVFEDLSEHPFMLHLTGFFFSLLLLCGMVATISTARTLTVHRKWIIRWVRFTRIHLYIYCWWFYFHLTSFHYKVHETLYCFLT